ncbi:hypothetical protein HAX54_021705 [Datura stramonium]|uniref:Uncharacterized protein n=1 Tax=Datura stramonium TaxID=4076 RepID=A0ABS8UTY1_DATST|nr:hypothetical protein [Datura stramonium]
MDRVSKEEEIEEIDMTPTTNTEGEPDADYVKFMVDRKNTSIMAYFSILYDNISETSMEKNQRELSSAVSETTPGSFPKPAPSTLALFPKFHVPSSKEKQPVTQMTFDLHIATAQVAELKRENAQLKADLPTSNA